MLKRILMLLCLMAAATPLLRAQEIPTEVRAGELQVGGGYAGGNPDYSPHHFYGPYIYTTFDFREHIGAEFNFRMIKEGSDPSNEGLYEKTYQIGPRYVWHVKRRYNPYVKLLVGRGVFQYAHNTANLAYNMYSFGGGLDVRVKPYLNVRVVDLEAQHWMSFPPHGLAPMAVSFGVAYRFH
ncbi:MAG: hypothetical protein P4L10_04155 [Acidobacteriaceae bacterium]|nr:hypothetical protein [Acidobacteriaceae bacterium]